MAKATAIMRDEQTVGGKLAQFPAKTKAFLADVRNEMRKVSFPSRKEVQATTVVVIITVFVFGAYFWLVDSILGHSLDTILRRLINR